MSATINPSMTKTNEWAVRFIAHDTPVSMVVGQATTVNLRIENIGMIKWLQGGDQPVRVAYKWFDASGQPALEFEDRRTGLPADIYPRQESAFGAVLVAPTIPGTYKLEWDLVAEGVTWFVDADNAPLVVPIFVTAVPRDITGWRVESNMNIAQVARALDGDPMTYWDAGALQTKGQWYRLNLGTPRLIDGIQLLSPGKGFPAAYVLYISSDGRSWTEIARVDSDNQYDVMAIFAPQSTQYIQINLLAPASSIWMISEILVHSSPAWTASASHNDKQASFAIDNRGDTAWSSDAAQTTKMWFQIDLGHPEMISGVTLIPPADEHPASYRVAIWNAGANRWQSVAEKLSNAELVDVTFEAIQSQFINIQLLQPSERPWAIQHVRVAREMERWLGPQS